MIYSLENYDEAYEYVTTHKGYTIKDLGNGQYEVVQEEPLPAPTKEEITEQRAKRYSAEVDPITSHIARLRDEEQTPEVQAEINALIAERSEKVAQIQKELPYPAE